MLTLADWLAWQHRHRESTQQQGKQANEPILTVGNNVAQCFASFSDDTSIAGMSLDSLNQQFHTAGLGGQYSGLACVAQKWHTVTSQTPFKTDTK
jgi:hypothetical protein